MTRNTRGAAFLLAVYMAALTLLLMGGVSLQRTTTELRAAHVSRDLHQGFYLAEGGLDQVLQVFRADPLLSDADAAAAITALSGATATVTTPSNAIQSDGSELRQVVLTGTRNGRTQRVYATLQLTGDGTMPYREGLFGSGAVFIGTSGSSNSGVLNIQGPIGVNSKNVGALILLNTEVQGPVWLGDQVDDGFQDVYNGRFVGPAHVYEWPDDYSSPGNAGAFVDGLDGFGPQGSGIQTINAQLSGQPSVGTIPVPVRPDLAAYQTMLSTCQATVGTVVQNGNLHLTSGKVYTVHDNDASPGQGLDLDATTPGKILLCQQSIVLAENSQLLFDAPATVYVVSSLRPPYPEAPTTYSILKAQNPGSYDHAPDSEWTDGAYLQQSGVIVQASKDGEPLRNGVELVAGGAGRTLVGVTGEFHGSIWAPGGGGYSWRMRHLCSSCTARGRWTSHRSTRTASTCGSTASGDPPRRSR